MTITRDSILWTLSMIGAAAVALASHNDMFPWIPESVQHGIEIVAFLYGIFAGKMATSPLPGKND